MMLAHFSNVKYISVGMKLLIDTQKKIFMYLDNFYFSNHFKARSVCFRVFQMTWTANWQFI